MDHLSITWCKQLMLTIIRALFDSVDPQTRQISNDRNYRNAVFRYHLAQVRYYSFFSTSVIYTLSEAWSGVNWADLMAAQGAIGTDFYDRSTKTIVGTMLWTEYRPVIKIDAKGALGSHEIRPRTEYSYFSTSVSLFVIVTSNSVRMIDVQ